MYASLYVRLEELEHPALKFFRVPLAGFSMPDARQTPHCPGFARGGKKFVEVGAVVIQLAVEEQDGTRGELTPKRTGSQRNRFTPRPL
ncbi:MAG: hypothetical protein N2508_02200 [Anaerolineae bacterium]|nr:hypothetical protein [Anaerolineae bacterium]